VNEDKPNKQEPPERPDDGSLWTKTWLVYLILNVVLLGIIVLATIIALKSGLIPGFD